MGIVIADGAADDARAASTPHFFAFVWGPAPEPVAAEGTPEVRAA